MFWTLDLNKVRYIVTAFSGKAHVGMQYLYWAGPGKNFEPKPLALSCISNSRSDATIAKGKNGILPDKSGIAPVNRKRSIPINSFESSDSSDQSDSSDSSDADTSESEVEGDRMRINGPIQRTADAGSEKSLRQIDKSTSDRADHSTS